MEAKKFREIEELYKDLKDRQAAGEVSPEDMKTELKKMMLRDEENRYWMLGGKTGGWYVYDGSAWKTADPYEREDATPVPQPDTAPARESRPAKEIVSPAASDASPEALCKFCHSRMNEHDAYCKFCGGSQKAPAKVQTRRGAEDEILFRSVRLVSLVFFFGGLGLVLGVIFGASFGIFTILGDWIYQFPVMLQEMRGKIQGGLFFGAMGGIAGFIGCALLSVLLGLFYNALAYVFGGLRFKIKS
jgi:hypothetical protein